MQRKQQTLLSLGQPLILSALILAAITPTATADASHAHSEKNAPSQQQTEILHHADHQSLNGGNSNANRDSKIDPLPPQISEHQQDRASERRIPPDFHRNPRNERASHQQPEDLAATRATVIPLTPSTTSSDTSSTHSKGAESTCNHGEAVSATAHSAPRGNEVHGDIVSSEAHQQASCKTASSSMASSFTMATASSSSSTQMATSTITTSTTVPSTSSTSTLTTTTSVSTTTAPNVTNQTTIQGPSIAALVALIVHGFAFLLHGLAAVFHHF